MRIAGKRVKGTYLRHIGRGYLGGIDDMETRQGISRDRKKPADAGTEERNGCSKHSRVKEMEIYIYICS